MSLPTPLKQRIVMQVGHFNPISDLVSDEVFALLEQHHLLDPKGIRDYQIRVRFRDLRDSEVGAYDAIERIREEHPYLQFDTIRKIVYRLNHK